jgi:hypothetical protein
VKAIASEAGAAGWFVRVGIPIAQFVVCVSAALVASVWLWPLAPRPAEAQWRLVAQGLSVLSLVAMLVPVTYFRQPRHRVGWTIAAAISALLGAWLGDAVIPRHMQRIDDWTCRYNGRRVIVGRGDALMLEGSRYMSRNPGQTCDGMIKDFAGSVEEIWSKASIDARRSQLANVYLPLPATMGCLLMIVTQAIAVAMQAKPHALLRLRVFIAYRRDDTKPIVDRLTENLGRRFEPGWVFRDIQSIAPGVDYRAAAGTAIPRCDVLLAVIGPRWLDVRNEDGTRRLDDPSDEVRREIEIALREGVPIIPVFYNATMPKAEALPESLRAFSSINGTTMRDDPDFAGDFDHLMAALSTLPSRQASVAKKHAG